MTPQRMRRPNTAATAIPTLETWLPSSVDDGRGVLVGGGAGAVLVVLVTRVELEMVLDKSELVEDGEPEVMVEVEEVDELEVIPEAAALSVELEAGFVDWDLVVAVDFVEVVAFTDVVEAPEDAVDLTLPVVVA